MTEGGRNVPGMAASGAAWLALTLAVGAMATAGTPVLAQEVAFDCAAVAASPAAGAATPVPPQAVTAVPPQWPAGEASLTVFAAASLTDAFSTLEGDLEAAHPGLDIVFNFGGSQALVTQLAQGAEADVFASANLAQMTAAQHNGSIAGDPVVFVRNDLAIVVPAANPAGIDDAADLANPGLKLVLAQPEVPAGRYAREAVCLMDRDADAFGEGFAANVAANVVSEEEDVRDVLAKVELGEADAGIVYVSDAQAGGAQVTTIAIPGEDNRVASYPIAPVAGGDPALAGAFIGAVLAPEGQAALAAAGFEPVAPIAATPAP